MSIIIDCPVCKKAGFILLACPICKGFGTINHRSDREKKKAKNEKSKKKASNAGKPFTKREILLLQNSAYSTPYLANRLKRSIKSIENMRYRLKKGVADGQ